MGVLSVLITILAVSGIVVPIGLAIINPNPSDPLLPKWAFLLIASGTFGVLAFIAVVKREREIANRNTARALAYRKIVELHGSGIALRNRGMPPLQDYTVEQWGEEADKWHVNVIEQLNMVSLRDIDHFKNLDWVPGRHDPQMNYTREHAKQLDEMSESIVRLKEIIDAHSTEPNLDIPKGLT